MLMELTPARIRHNPAKDYIRSMIFQRTDHS